MKQGRESGCFNIGTGNGNSVTEVVNASSAVTGAPIPVQHGPRRLGDPAILVASDEQLRWALKWKPRYDNLSAIVASAWTWHHESDCSAALAKAPNKKARQ